jgi:hypothetical protein
MVISSGVGGERELVGHHGDGVEVGSDTYVGNGDSVRGCQQMARVAEAIATEMVVVPDHGGGRRK